MAVYRFPLNTAQIVALFVESIFYGQLRIRFGMFLITFFHCLRVLVWEDGHIKSWRRLHWKMLVASLLMFIFASLDVAFGLRHNIEAFVYFQGGAIEDFERLSNWVNVMKMVDYVGQTFVGDAILLYRCWVIYSRNWLVIMFPLLMWLGETACGIMAAYREATLPTDGSGMLNTSRLSPWITGLLSLTLAMNLITTSLIVYRIWNIQRVLKHRSVTTVFMPLTSVTRVLIESGTFYTISIVILFVVYMLSNNAELAVSDALVQIIVGLTVCPILVQFSSTSSQGITFNIIITRADRGDATQPIDTKASDGTIRFAMPLHMIDIRTTVTRHQEPDEISESTASPIGAKRAGYWNPP
ncbi:hypothetical protein F5887DRAFT_1282876 [Amanita rubescens]|nr:hypothetical protein F5887DRAFT_1282876 [Amanita rubescens]